MRRIALISGGSSGIGEACVRLFAKDGWAVVFLCRTHPERAQAITDELRGKGLDVAFRTCDIADSEQVNDTVAAILKDYKHIDALVNCAGIAYRGLLTDMPDATWHHLLATDLDSVFYLQRAVLPGMISRGHGAIVNVSSMWGEVGASCEAAYSAATQFNFAITCPSSSTSTKPMTSPCAIGASTLSGSCTDSDKPLCCPFFSSIESPLPSASGTLSALPPRTSTFCPSKSPLFAITTRRYAAKP